MLPSWVNRLVLALALAVLPLQGFAQTIQVLLCHPQNAASTHSAGILGHAEHDHGAEAPHAQHAVHEDMSHQDKADPSGSAHGSHFCCDLAAAAAMPAFVTFLADYRCSQIATAATSRCSTYLELPQRPPLI
jgi:hypothetical protein